MKQSAWAVAAATSVIACVALLRPVYADPPSVAPAVGPVALSRGPNAALLDARTKQLRFNEVAKANGLGPVNFGGLQEFRLTPVAPRLPSGAEIDRTTGIQFYGTEPGQPDGSYTMTRVFNAMPMSSIDMKFQTQTGKFYVFDCRVNVASSSAKINWARAGVQGVNSTPIDNGHLYGGFVASSAVTTFVLTYFTGDPNASTLGYFYGCDFSKGN